MRRTIDVELNRVEGDLAIEVDIENEQVVDARCVGTLYRGFEQIMIGRDAFDALVITPRVCGMCSTAHLYAAALALEHAWQVEVPPLATLVRDLGMMCEFVQGDLRQTFIFFTVDFVNPRYRAHRDYQDIETAFAPFRGRLHRETIEITRKPLEILALYGGQWPHSSWIVPGGITGHPDDRKAIASQAILDDVTRWFETVVIGGPLDAWLALDTPEALLAWDEARPDSGASLMNRFAHSIGLHRSGIGTAAHLSFGSQLIAEEWQPPYDRRTCRLPAGTLSGATAAAVQALDPAAITEHVAHAWYADYPGGLNPAAGRTVPNYPGAAEKYSWIKAPRYRDEVMQTGALSELAIAGEPLIHALLAGEGANTWLRQFARLRRAGQLLAEMKRQLHLIHAAHGQAFLNPVSPTHAADGDGHGLLEASRGALGHWVGIRGGKISHYQIVTPTTWNASPRDSAGRPGHWEQSLIGTPVADPDDPIEVAHIVRSHDPCFVCSVHVTDASRQRHFGG